MAKTHPRRVSRLARKMRAQKKRVAERGVPRVCVYRSNRHLYAQIIDDQAGKVLGGASTKTKTVAANANGKSDIAAAKLVGTAVAEVAKKQNIERVCFDRNGFKYHGRIKAIADAAREAGLKF